MYPQFTRGVINTLPTRYHTLYFDMNLIILFYHNVLKRSIFDLFKRNEGNVLFSINYISILVVTCVVTCHNIVARSR